LRLSQIIPILEPRVNDFNATCSPANAARQPDIMNTFRRHSGLLVGLFGTLVFCTGCVTSNPALRDPASPSWLSKADMDACETLARSAAAKDYPEIRLATEESAIFCLENWRECRCTVYLPVAFTNVAPEEKPFLSFVFSNSVPYHGIADVYSFAQIARGNMILTEEKLLLLNPTAIHTVH
ncbi:MAG TPA: hypothetical protein VFY06_00625, partial [Verrucomicrobiae bacterium]|nr:hypothetical protein [Verrucomicrobiae bacterium]